MPGNRKQQAQLIRIAVLPVPGMKIFYSNALQTKIVRGLLLTASLSLAGKRQEGPFSACTYACLAMNAGARPASYKRLSPGLQALFAHNYYHHMLWGCPVPGRKLSACSIAHMHFGHQDTIALVFLHFSTISDCNFFRVEVVRYAVRRIVEF